jgi:hypothetical protein
MMGVRRRMPEFKQAFILIFASILSYTLSVQALASAEEYTFDISEIEKKAYQIDGKAEIRPVIFGLDKDAALYKLKFYNRDDGSALKEYNAKLQLEGSFEKGIARFFARTNTDYKKSYLGEDQKTSVYVGFLSIKSSPSLTLDIGKKSLKWGKGYAWNPVAFADRPKDPDEPELGLEGYIVASADYIKSFEGPLKTVSFTPVLIPVYEHVNDTFGDINNLNFAGRLYLLFYDTDIDFIMLAGGSRTTRYGVDFSRNITTNFEVHVEFAYIRDYKKNILESDGTITRQQEEIQSYLIGIRYLTSFDLTTIIEYYHNGTGYRANEMKDYYSFINRGYDTYLTTGNDTALIKARNITETGYGRISPMEDYLSIRLSQKEPFDILYFTPALTMMINLNDNSYSLTPEFLYTGITNLEQRLRTGFIAGARNTKFGEKQNDYRVELRAAYYF